MDENNDGKFDKSILESPLQINNQKGKAKSKRRLMIIVVAFIAIGVVFYWQEFFVIISSLLILPAVL